MKKKVSFDFDFTLSRKVIQQYAGELVACGHEVWIVTSRYDDNNLDKYPDKSYNNNDLYTIAVLVGIPRTQIQFMNMSDKCDFFINKDFIWHLDDDVIEINMINVTTKTKGISCYRSTNWKYKCERLLNETI